MITPVACSVAAAVSDGDASLVEVDTLSILKKVDRAIYYRNFNIDSCLLLADQALKESVFGKYNKGIGRAIRAMAVYHTIKGDFNKAVHKANEALTYSSKAKDWENIAWVYDGMSVIMRFKGDYDSAIVYTEKSFDSFAKNHDQRGMARSYNVMGYLMEKKGNLMPALDYFDRSLQISQPLNDSELILYSYTQMLGVFLLQEDYQKALSYAFRNLKQNENNNNVTSVSQNYRLIASVYFQQEKYDQALQYSLKSLELSREIGHLVITVENCARIASIYVYQNSYQKALEYLEEGWGFAQSMESKEAKASMQLSYARYYLSLKQYTKALEAARQARAWAEDIGNRSLHKDAAAIITSSSELLGDYQTALGSFKEFKSIEDSLLNMRILNKALQQEYQRNQEQEQQAYEASLREQQLLRNGAIIAFLVMVVFSIVLLWAFDRQRKAKHINAHQRNEIQEHRNKLKKLNQELNNQKEEITAQAETLKKANEALNIAYKEITLKNRNITDSINYANRIQQSILPLKTKMDESLGHESYFVLYKPKDIVSGDFYWHEEIGSKKIIAVADCTGHGVPGAFMSLLGNDLLQQLVNGYKITSPDLILDMLHQGIRKALHQDHNEGMDGMEIVILVIDKDHYVAEFSGAMSPLYYVQNGELFIVKGTKASVGGRQAETTRYFEKHQIDLSVPTTFYLCTDGFKDQFGGKQRKKFKPKPFRELLLSLEYHSMEQQRELLLHTFETWMITGNEQQVDDMTVLGIRV